MPGLPREDDGGDLHLQERPRNLRDLQAQGEDLRQLQDGPIHLQEQSLGADGPGNHAEGVIHRTELILILA